MIKFMNFMNKWEFMHIWTNFWKFHSYMHEFPLVHKIHKFDHGDDLVIMAMTGCWSCMKISFMAVFMTPTLRWLYWGSLSMIFCIAVSEWFLLEYHHYCGPGQTVQTEDADKIRPNFRPPSLEFPPLWNHPAKNSSQVLGGNECTKR